MAGRVMQQTSQVYSNVQLRKLNVYQHYTTHYSPSSMFPDFLESHSNVRCMRNMLRDGIKYAMSVRSSNDEPDLLRPALCCLTRSLVAGPTCEAQINTEVSGDEASPPARPTLRNVRSSFS